ncbi:P-loop containing nucleoside triphosphate hydrolase protein [Scleroderma yunnanense]
MVGPSGAGKSSFVNMVTGSQGQRVGHSLTSCTSEINAVRCTILGSTIVLLDTPGFKDTNKSDTEILKSIVDWLSKRKGTLLSGILYFHRITDDRITGTAVKYIPDFQRLCGENGISKIVLTTTMWDGLEEEVGIERLKGLKRNYWKPMAARGSTAFRYLNTRQSAEELLLHLLGR